MYTVNVTRSPWPPLQGRRFGLSVPGSAEPPLGLFVQVHVRLPLYESLGASYQEADSLDREDATVGWKNPSVLPAGRPAVFVQAARSPSAPRPHAPTEACRVRS